MSEVSYYECEHCGLRGYTASRHTCAYQPVITRDKIIEAVGKWNDRKTTNEDDLIEFLLKELGL